MEEKSYICDNCGCMLVSSSGDPREEVYYVESDSSEAVLKKVCKDCE